MQDARYSFLVEWLDPQVSCVGRILPLAMIVFVMVLFYLPLNQTPVLSPQAQLVRQYLLFYYSADNTIEMVSFFAPTLVLCTPLTLSISAGRHKKPSKISAEMRISKYPI
jgi:hypothetical protein